MQKQPFYLHKNFFSRMVCDQEFLSEEMRRILNDPEDYIRRKNAKIIQNNFKNKIVYLEIGKIPAIIKIHNYKSLWHKIKRYFRRTRASRSWHYSVLFNENGIRTPRPIAYKETRIGPLRGDSYFIYEWVDGINGEQYFLNNRKDVGKIKKAITSILEITEKIKNLGLIHGDIRLKNMVFREDEIFLTDFDDTKKKKWYKLRRMNNRDFRGLIHDIYHNVPREFQPFFLSQLELLGDDIKQVVRYCSTKYNWQT
ncbi:MAG TPA: lipopolysaccharide kinase InaA family protein [Smithellaceae bacterium]|nr:lipopolysaccharide kinase InaA family protein [Smithellaceae bacterium]